jgi:hypothetical protein
MDAVLFGILNGTFFVRQVSRSGIENCRTLTADFSEQYRPISLNVPGSLGSKFDE